MKGGHFDSLFDGIVPSLCAYSDETTWHPRWWRMPLENPRKCHFRDSKFHNVASCHVPQELVPWCEFQSRLQFIIICLLLKKFLTAACSQVTVKCTLVLDVCTTAFCIPKNIDSWWVLMKLFLIFFPSLASVHKSCRLIGFFFLLFSKESHGGKNLSYVTMLLIIICFWFLNYVDTFTHYPMTAYFVKNLTQLRVLLNDWMKHATVKLKAIMDQGSMDPHFGPGP